MANVSEGEDHIFFQIVSIVKEKVVIQDWNVVF